MPPDPMHYAPIESVPLSLPLLAVCGSLCDVDDWTTISTNVSCPECMARLQRKFETFLSDHRRERRRPRRLVARLRRVFGT